MAHSLRSPDSQLSHIWCGGGDLKSSGWRRKTRICRLTWDIWLHSARSCHRFHVRAHNFPAHNASSNCCGGVPRSEAAFAASEVLPVVLLIKRRRKIEMLNLLELPGCAMQVYDRCSRAQDMQPRQECRFLRCLR